MELHPNPFPAFLLAALAAMAAISAVYIVDFFFYLFT